MAQDTLARLRVIDREILKNVVRQDMQSSAFEINSWQVEPLGHVVMNQATGGLFRFSGSGSDDQGERPWNVVLKVVNHPPDSEKIDRQSSGYWKREILACQSCMLKDLPGPIAVPCCYGVIENPEQTWIWMEHIVESAPKHWKFEHFAFAAHELSRFNAAFLNGAPLPTNPWLCNGFYQDWFMDGGFWQVHMNPASQDNAWEGPIVQKYFSTTLQERIMGLWGEKQRFIAALERLPQVFCHHDYHRRNLMIRKNADGANQVIALDWNFTGRGAIGIDLGQLVALSLFFYEREPYEAEALYNQCFEAYQAGLEEAGWGSQLEAARLGSLIPAAICTGLILPSFAYWYTIPGYYKDTAFEQFGRAEDEMVSGWVALSEFSLQCAEQVRHILEQRSW